jgi:hypothetical protein
MPSRYYPATAGALDYWVIHTQSVDCRAATRGHANDTGFVLAPHKMFTPSLTQRMKQGYSLSTQRIDSSLLRRFGDIARETRQAGILFNGRPADSFRNNVVHVHA